MKTKRESNRDELKPEYNFDYSKAVRGKYYRRLLEEGSNVVVLEPDLARTFLDSSAVNEALRSLLDLAKSTRQHESTTHLTFCGNINLTYKPGFYILICIENNPYQIPATVERPLHGKDTPPSP